MKDIRAKIFQSIDFLLHSDELLVSEMEKLGLTDFVSELKRVESKNWRG